MGALQYTYDPTTPGSFTVSFRRCSRVPGTWREELYAAARDIVNESPKPLWLCFSGGIDSEIMCQAFFDHGIHFSVLTLEHTGGTNAHDIAYARAWCEAHGVTQKIVPLDIDTFFEQDIERYIREGAVAGHPFWFQQIKLMETAESLGGRAVLGGGEHLYHIPEGVDPLSPEDVYHRYYTGFTASLEWNRRHGSDHRPYFFLQTPELIRSYLDLPFIECALAHPESLRNPSNKYNLKRFVFHAEWPESVSRPKYDGYEKIRPKIVEKSRELIARFGSSLQSYDLKIMKLKRDLTFS